MSFEGRQKKGGWKLEGDWKVVQIKLELGVCVTLVLDVVCFRYVESIYEVGVCVIGASLLTEVGCVGYWC